jgi:DNA-directed RNA polymerase specialized sigma24 family protein
LVIAAPIVAYPTPQQYLTSIFNNLCIVPAQMDLSDPQTLRRVFEEHERGVYATALRILGNPAQAQDVVQDVFLRIWRRPGAFDARRGEVGSYLRMIAGEIADREQVPLGTAKSRIRLGLARLRQECPALAHEAA